MASSPEPLPHFGRYEALFRIAAGGMAEVFAARIRGEAGFEKFVAVKRMLPHMVEDENFVNMFLDEARLAVQVTSPHVVQTLDLGRADDGALYIAMELVVGASLAVLIREARKRNQRVPPAIALELLAQAAQGLDDAHEATTQTGMQLGIVHRDVSPHNLLIGIDGRTRVSDFGIARAMLRRTSTAAGELKGKFSYFSPEQAAGQLVDRRSDIFALGIIAWECLLQRRLFAGNDMLHVLALVQSQEIPFVHEVDPSLPASVGWAVGRALARPVDERYATAHEFAVALREAAREIGPAPSPREIGRWVADTAAETVDRIRGQLDATQIDHDAETVARDASSSYRSGAGSASRRVPTHPSTPPPSSVVSSTALSPGHDASTLAASLLPSDAPAAPGPGPGRWIAGGALVVAAAVGAFLGARQMSAHQTAVAPVESVASTTPPPPASSPPEPAASAAPVVSARVEPPNPRTIRKGTKGAPTSPAATAPATAPATTAAPAATPTQAPPPATHPTADKKGPSGPLLGDDAFKLLSPHGRPSRHLGLPGPAPHALLGERAR